MKKKAIPVDQRIKLIAPYLDNDEIEKFISICHIKTLKNKEIVIKANSFNGYSGIILKGVLRGYFTNSEGVEITSIIRVENTFFAVPEWFVGNEPTKYNIESILESEVLLFKSEELEKLALHNPGILKLVLSGFKESYNTLISRLESMIQKKPEERYIELLEKNPLFLSKAFNKHIANYLGMNPVSLSRITKRVRDARKAVN